MSRPTLKRTLKSAVTSCNILLLSRLSEIEAKVEWMKYIITEKPDHKKCNITVNKSTQYAGTQTVQIHNVVKNVSEHSTFMYKYAAYSTVTLHLNL